MADNDSKDSPGESVVPTQIPLLEDIVEIKATRKPLLWVGLVPVQTWS